MPKLQPINQERYRSLLALWRDASEHSENGVPTWSVLMKLLVLAPELIEHVTTLQSDYITKTMPFRFIGKEIEFFFPTHFIGHDYLNYLKEGEPEKIVALGATLHQMKCGCIYYSLYERVDFPLTPAFTYVLPILGPDLSHQFVGLIEKHKDIDDDTIGVENLFHPLQELEFIDLGFGVPNHIPSDNQYQ
jgi:hypothetical protein